MKRLISLILTLTIFCSFLSFSGTAFASTETYTLSAVDSGYVYRNNPNSSYSQDMLVIDNGAYRVSFLKYDLSSIKSKIKSTDTFSLSLVVWELVNTGSDSCISVSLLPADCEAWSSAELNYNNAGSLLASSDAALVTSSDLTKKTYDLEFSASNIYSHLAQDTDDAIICLMVKSAGTGGCTFRKVGYSTSGQLTLTHIIDAEDVVNEVYESLTYATITNEEPTAVTSKLNLPSSGSSGTVISWVSSNEDVIDPQSGAVNRPRLGEDDASVRLTATIQNGEASKTKYFDFVVKNSNRAPESMLLSAEIYPDVQTMVNGGSNSVNTSYNGNQLVIDNGSRMTFMKFDFSSYEEIYKTIDSVAFHFGTGGDCEPESNENITLCVLPDSMEQYVTNELTWTIANTQGMTTYTGDSIYSLSALKNAQKYTTASFLEDIEKNFAENTSNKTFAIKLVETTGNGYTLYNSSLGSYMYKPRLIVGYSIPDYKKDALLLELPSVVNDDITLPSSGVYGSPIKWESSNPSLINSDGTVRVDTANEDYRVEDEYAYLTATVSEDDKSETARFKVRVRRKGIVDASFDTYITSDSNYYDDDEIVLNSETGNIGILAFDLSSEYDYALSSRKIVLKLYSSNENAADSLKLVPITDLEKKTANLKNLSYDDAIACLSSGEATLSADVNSNGHYIFDVTEYIWEQNDKKAVFALVCDGTKTDLYSGTNLCLEPKLVISPLAYTDEFAVSVAKDELTFSDISNDDPSAVRKNLTLPQKGRYYSDISWHVSPAESVIISSGEVVRGSTNQNVILTATIAKGSKSLTKDFEFTLVKSETDEDYARYLLNTLYLPCNILTSDITLPGSQMPDGAVVTWQSSEDYEAKVDGFKLKLTRPSSNHLPVVLTASINYNGVTVTRDFNITVLRAQNKNILSYKLVKSGDTTASNAVDDSVDTVWNVISPEVVYDLGSTSLINGFSIIPASGDISDIEIYMSADNLIWEKVYSGTALKAGELNSFAPDTTALGRYIKFVAPRGSSISYIAAYSTVSSYEDEVFSGISIPTQTSSGFALSVSTSLGQPISWTSSSPVITVSGSYAAVTPAFADTLVTLTAAIADGTKKTFVVLVPKATSGGSSPLGGGSSTSVNSSYPATTNTGTSSSPQIASHFTDLTDASWAVLYINELYERGVVNGVGDNTFAPNNNLKREESAKIIAASLGITSDNVQSTFTDVQDGEWYTDYIMAMYSAGIINGIGDGSFGVGINVTRQDAFCMVAGALKYLGVSAEATQDMTFNDSRDIADYAKDAIDMLYGLGVLNGDTEGNINPTQMITRAEFSKVMYYAIKLLG